jgi:hypothetical protein
MKMKKSTMLMIAGSIAAVILSGCASDRVSVSRWDNSPSQPVDNRDGLERQGFVRTGATEYVKPNAYGLGTGMNQFGGAVKVVPAN